MKNSLALFLCWLVLLGCAREKPQSTLNGASVPANLPPELAEYAKTPEGRQVLETVKKWKEQIDRTKETLLHETDHPAVLAASRDVIRTRSDYARDPKWHGPVYTDVSLIAPDDPKLPIVIRRLKAVSIFASDDDLRIEFGGGFHHYGLIAQRDGVNDKPSREGYTKLIDGLGFYEDPR